MQPERRQKIKDIFVEARRRGPDQRVSFLEKACGGDMSLLAQVESLLEHDEVAENKNFLGDRATLSDVSSPTTVAPEIPGEVGGHELLGELGHGGMGVVYLARSIKLNRRVALKTILKGQLATTEDVERFIAEAQAVAGLEHPNIVSLYEVGEQDGLHYFTMEFVDGQDLATRLEQGPLLERDAAELVSTIAHAVDYAHHRNILHRDLKPSNILLTTDNTPKITDFGLAKVLDSATAKTHTTVVGTPSYMSPEQASGKTKGLGPRTDVYALGAIMYAAVTGRPPFQASTSLETLEQVRSREPVSPRKRQPKLSRDAETICQKCLQKEPMARYESARALAEDLERHLRGEPIRGRRVGYGSRAWRWCRRHPALMVTAVTILVTVTAVLGLQLQSKLHRQEQESERRAAYIRDMRLAEQAWESGDVREVLACLDRHESPPTDGEDLREWEWYYQQRLCQQEIRQFDAQTGAAFDVAIHPNRRQLAGAYRDGKIRIWDIASGNLKTTLAFEAPEPSSADELYPTTVAFSADGNWVAAGGIGGQVTIWSLQNPAQPRILNSPVQDNRQLTDTVWEVAFSPDGSWLAACDNAGAIAIWDAASLNLYGRIVLPIDHDASRSVSDIEFNSQGSLLAAACADGKLRVWDVKKATTSSEPLQESRSDVSSRVYCVAFHPDGDKVAFAGHDSFVRIVEARGGKLLGKVEHHQGFVRSIAFSHDGNRLAVASEDAKLNVWDCADLALPKLKRNIRGHLEKIYTVTFGGDDHFLASASADGTIKLWDSRAGVDSQHIAGGHHDRPVGCVQFMPDGKRMVSADQRGVVCVWDTRSMQLLNRWTAHDAEIAFIAVNSEGVLATAGADEKIHLWRDATESLVGTLVGHEGMVTHVEFSHDGRYLASAGADRTVILWDAETRQEIHVLHGHKAPVYSVAFSPDDSKLASVDDVGVVNIWRASDGKTLETITESRTELRDVSFSPDGTEIATCSKAGGIVFRDTSSFAVLRTCSHDVTVDSSAIFNIGFLPTGNRIVSAGGDRTLRVWDTHTGKLVRTLRGHDNQVQCIAVSSDGMLLASSSYDNNVRLWDARPLSTQLRTEREAVGLATHLSERPLAPNDMLELIEEWPSASQEVKAVAANVALHFPSAGKRLAQAYKARSRSIVKRRCLPTVQYDIAKRQARTAYQYDPGIAEETLDWARFRTGEETSAEPQGSRARSAVNVTRVPKYLINAVEIELTAENVGASTGELELTEEHSDSYFFMIRSSGRIAVEVEPEPPLLVMSKLYRVGDGPLERPDTAASNSDNRTARITHPVQSDQIYFLQVSKLREDVAGIYTVRVRPAEGCAAD